MKLADTPLTELRACPHCDALYRLVPLRSRERGTCPQCNHVLVSPRSNAFRRVIALSTAALVMLAVALFTPFLDLSAAGLHSDASIWDTAMTFSSGYLTPLAVAVVAFIIIIPALRLSLILYTLVPLSLNLPAARHAAGAYRLSEILHPWSMAEIFVIGVAVALVKIAGMASVAPGIAFWTFAALVIVIIWQESFLDSEQIWSAIDSSAPRVDEGAA
ncbi:paraquat-inducible protein A [Falsirhodobacter sp. alg1]|uniref:paraquat-inducible protein A n=1 Tax=Falsirhodobacter sp. alg1 TaxID=1472418 RepID=UPI0005EE508D|nr:paraquat-inducible protein A [Falsirhodobacter sp. alg1]